MNALEKIAAKRKLTVKLAKLLSSAELAMLKTSPTFGGALQGRTPGLEVYRKHQKATTHHDATVKELARKITQSEGRPLSQRDYRRGRAPLREQNLVAKALRDLKTYGETRMRSPVKHIDKRSIKLNPKSNSLRSAAAYSRRVPGDAPAMNFDVSTLDALKHRSRTGSGWKRS